MYEWWPGARAQLQKAGVETWEVIDVVYSERRWPRPVRTPEGAPGLSVWGRTGEGRPLVVLLRRLHQPGAADIWQIVLAVPMGPRQLKEFTAWEANR